jgi:hypothetical protein
MSPNPKAFKKLPLGWSQKLQANSENLKRGGGGDEIKRKASGQNIKREYQKPLGCPLTLKTCSIKFILVAPFLGKKKSYIRIMCLETIFFFWDC